jgi:hypothetical protein
MVVFPEPDGAENTINFPFFILSHCEERPVRRGGSNLILIIFFILDTNYTSRLLHEVVEFIP